MREKTKLKVKIFQYFEDRCYQKYTSSIELFDLHVSKWPSISGKITPIVLSKTKSNVNPVQEADYFIQKHPVDALGLYYSPLMPIPLHNQYCSNLLDLQKCLMMLFYNVGPFSNNTGQAEQNKFDRGQVEHFL
jgi:hypothetical protein